MKIIELRSNGTKRVATKNEKPSMTDPQYGKECDVNYIIERAKKTGQIAHIAQLQGKFADVSKIDSLHDSLIQVQHAQEIFKKLPLNIQRRFDYNMKDLLMFLDNPSNRKEAEELGLIPVVKKPYNPNNPEKTKIEIKEPTQTKSE